VQRALRIGQAQDKVIEPGDARGGFLRRIPRRSVSLCERQRSVGIVFTAE
jgi:hypothetical protein